MFTACATSNASRHGNPFIRDGKPKMELPAEALRQGAAGETLESVIAKTRELTARATPPKRVGPATLESTNQRLAAALRQLQSSPSADSELEVADAYRAAGILDQAYDHYAAARRLDTTAAAAYDGIARVWRDWHQPGFALGEAYRAVHYAPHSPEPWNTLGTVLEALGNRRDAQHAYGRAMAADPTAQYAVTNWCRSAAQLGSADEISSCAHVAAARQASAVTAAAGERFRTGVRLMAYGAFALASETLDAAVRDAAAVTESQKGVE